MIDFEKIISAADMVIPPKSRLVLTPVKGKGGIYDSKLCGTPYFPKSMEYPRGTGEGTGKNYKDKPLRLLVQLNFEQLPKFEGFPDKGILQIFIACENDALYGFNYRNTEEQTVQNGFRVIYHKDIISDETLLYSEEDIPSEQFSDDECDFPLMCEFILKAEKADMGYGTSSDYKYTQALVEKYNEVCDKKADNYWDLDDEIFDRLKERNGEPTAFMGGFPIFEQEDPRESVPGFERFDTVLFELTSLESEEINDWGGHDFEIIWGDVGTGSFLISKENLAALDFSDVLYNYDCG